MRTAFVTLLFASLFVTPLLGQSQQAAKPGGPVKGVVLVKFAPEGLPALKQRIRPNDLNAKGNRPLNLQSEDSHHSG
jgi:hypothetical protein